MKQQQKIDRIFRDKLDTLEVAPSAKAWSAVEKGITKSKKLYYYWSAVAAILLLATVWVFTSDSLVPNSKTEIAAFVEYPKEINEPMFSWIELKEETPEVQQKTRKITLPRESKTAQKPSVQVANEIETNLKNIALDTAIIKTEMVAKEENEITEEETISYQPVKITYIASKVNLNSDQLIKNDTSGVFKKVVAFADKIDPGTMLADLREAKDNLFKADFLNKKERKTVAP